MGFIESRQTAVLPADVPNAVEAARSHPDGQLFESTEGKKRFRLQHARWVPVGTRKKGVKGGAAGTAAAGGNGKK